MKTYRSLVEELTPQQKKYNEETKLSTKQILADSLKIANEIAKKYESHATGKTSSPAAPNTGSFRATQSGMIKVLPNSVIPDGMFRRNYFSFIQVGSNVPLDVLRKIKAEYRTKIQKKFKLTGTPAAFVSTDMDRFFIDDVSGTSWGGIGLNLAEKLR